MIINGDGLTLILFTLQSAMNKKASKTEASSNNFIKPEFNRT